MFSRTFFLAALCVSFVLSSDICYYPSGDTSTDVPCDPNALFSHCCGTHDACLTNGLCALEATENTGISYARGTCTDKSWESSLCPQQCQLNQDTPNNASAYDFRSGGVQIWECGTQGYGERAKYCCESDAEKQRCCSTSTAVFQLAAATPGPFTGDASTTSNVVSSSSSTTTTRNSVTPSSRAGPNTSPAETRSASAAAPTVTTPSNTESNSNNGVKIGAAVGGAAGGLLLLAGVILLFLWQKKRHERIVAGLRQQQLNELASDGKVNYGYSAQQVPMEIDGSTTRHELPTYETAHELQGRTRYELPKDAR